jgi:hypothetical protein
LENIQALSRDVAPAAGGSLTDLLHKTDPATVLDVLLAGSGNGAAGSLVTRGLEAVAASVIPGFGGSLLALGIGVAAHYFSNKIVQARTDDHASGANLAL